MKPWIHRAGAVAALLTGQALADESYRERLEAAPDGIVEIANVAGEVLVRGTDDEAIEVTGRIGDGVEEVVFERDGDVVVLRVEVRGRGWGGWGDDDGSADLEVRLPRRSQLRVEAVSADIDVADVDGRLELESVSGDIDIVSAARSLDASTMSGDVDLAGAGQEALATVSSVSGDVVVRGIGGDVDATSVSGELELRLGETMRLRAQSTSGDVSVRARLRPGARVEIETVSGEAELRLDGDRDGDYSLETFSGDLDNCFGPEAERRRFAPGRSLRFREGEGDREVRISSMSGSIRLCD